jgi:hypothetical protein
MSIAFKSSNCFLLASVFLFFGLPARAHSPALEMTDAAANFLAALKPEQKAKAVYEFKDEERYDWHFIPKERKGLPLKEMSPAQRALAHALLSSALSQRGYAKAATIMSLEQILFDLEKQSPKRDAELYYFTVFGKPGTEKWGWRVEGHHLSLNFAANASEVTGVAPAFFGTNPARILEGPRQGLRVLAAEEDLAREFVKSLDAEQKKSAVITNIAPRDIITGHDREAKPLEPLGIAATALTSAQKDKLMTLIEEFAFRYRAEIAEGELKQIRGAGDANIHFAWAGGLESGQGHYYRIQGPKFLVEYDNTQDNNNHIHTVWRDLGNDFGDDPLRQHYQQVPHAK